MLIFTKPLANENTKNRIYKAAQNLFDQKRLTTGLKACTKRIINKNSKNLIFVAKTDIFPMDLLTHIPILCEHNDIPYIFVDEGKFIKNFTCVLLEIEDQEKYDKIKKYCKYI